MQTASRFPTSAGKSPPTIATETRTGKGRKCPRASLGRKPLCKSPPTPTKNPGSLVEIKKKTFAGEEGACARLQLLGWVGLGGRRCADPPLRASLGDRSSGEGIPSIPACFSSWKSPGRAERNLRLQLSSWASRAGLQAKAGLGCPVSLRGGSWLEPGQLPPGGARGSREARSLCPDQRQGLSPGSEG